MARTSPRVIVTRSRTPSPSGRRARASRRGCPRSAGEAGAPRCPASSAAIPQGPRPVVRPGEPKSTWGRASPPTSRGARRLGASAAASARRPVVPGATNPPAGAAPTISAAPSPSVRGRRDFLPLPGCGHPAAARRQLLDTQELRPAGPLGDHDLEVLAPVHVDERMGRRPEDPQLRPPGLQGPGGAVDGDPAGRVRRAGDCRIEGAGDDDFVRAVVVQVADRDVGAVERAEAGSP